MFLDKTTLVNRFVWNNIKTFNKRKLGKLCHHIYVINSMCFYMTQTKLENKLQLQMKLLNIVIKQENIKQEYYWVLS